MLNPATVEDVRTFYPALTTSEEDRAKRLVQVAWLRLQIIPGLRLTARIGAGKLDPDVVASVIGEMVANVLKNAEGARSRSHTVTIDDYTETEQVTIDQALSEGLLYPTEGMLKLLRVDRSGAWTVRPS